jgi:hypothetical protein
MSIHNMHIETGRRSEPVGWWWVTNWTIQKFMIIVVLTIFVLVSNLTSLRSVSAAFDSHAQNPIPLMAYYYIWFNTESWGRAKTDFPLLGHYSSDDRTVMEQHIRTAKAAGIDGFIVSWKSTATLNSRLEQLIDVAAAEDFYLWIIYQGLDFQRNPLSIDQIDHDFEYFNDRYADNPVFHLYDRPVVIWSGTWEFSPEEIYSVTNSYRDHFFILASERNVEGYLRLAEMVDGNAYYWSSVDPRGTPRYQEKLNEMSQVVHEYSGLWVAPAAPGFDARLIGGTRVIERHGGETLRRELNAALHSGPDVIGLISWNEFSENSHIEPSEEYGSMALDVLSNRQGTQVRQVGDFDSSEPGTINLSSYYNLCIGVGMFFFIVTSIIITILRRVGTAKSEASRP